MVHRSSTIRRRSQVFHHHVPLVTSQSKNDVIDAKMSAPTAALLWSAVAGAVMTSVCLVGPFSLMSVVMTTVFVAVAGFAAYCRLIGGWEEERGGRRLDRRRTSCHAVGGRLPAHSEERRNSFLVEF